MILKSLIIASILISSAQAKEKETKETKPAVTCVADVKVAKNKDKELTVSDCKKKQGNVTKPTKPNKADTKSQ